MSTYYDYFLEKKTDDGWHKLINVFDEDAQQEPFSIYWHSGSFGGDSTQHYSMNILPFEEWNIEDQIKYKNLYDNKDKEENRYEWLPEFKVLNLKQMIEDYTNGIHECSGIMTKNDVLKLKQDCDYCPDLVSPEDFNKLPKDIQDNYQYYAWDTWWSDYKNAYELVPLIFKMLDYYHLSLADVRLTYNWG